MKTLLIYLLSASLAKANIFVKDTRSAAPDVMPYRIVGVLKNTQLDSHGTAFLVHACYILTAKHVVDASVHSTSGLIFEQKGFVSGVTIVKQGQGEDWALLKLNTCLPANTPVLKLKSVSNFDFNHKKILQVGFPFDRETTSATLDSNCKIDSLNSSDSLLLHSCASRAGNSGSPLIVNFEGEFFVIGLTISEVNGFIEVIRNYTPVLANKGLPARLFIDQVTEVFNEARQSK